MGARCEGDLSDQDRLIIANKTKFLERGVNDDAPPTVADAPGADLLERLPLAVIVGADDGVAYINRAAREFTGYTAATLEASGGIGALLPGRRGASGAIAVRCQDGRLRYANVVMSPVTWSDRPAVLFSLQETEDSAPSGAQPHEAQPAQTASETKDGAMRRDFVVPQPANANTPLSDAAAKAQRLLHEAGILIVVNGEGPSAMEQEMSAETESFFRASLVLIGTRAAEGTVITVTRANGGYTVRTNPDAQRALDDVAHSPRLVLSALQAGLAVAPDGAGGLSIAPIVATPAAAR